MPRRISKSRRRWVNTTSHLFCLLHQCPFLGHQRIMRTRHIQEYEDPPPVSFAPLMLFFLSLYSYRLDRPTSSQLGSLFLHITRCNWIPFPTAFYLTASSPFLGQSNYGHFLELFSFADLMASTSNHHCGHKSQPVLRHVLCVRFLSGHQPSLFGRHAHQPTFIYSSRIPTIFRCWRPPSFIIQKHIP